MRAPMRLACTPAVVVAFGARERDSLALENALEREKDRKETPLGDRDQEPDEGRVHECPGTWQRRLGFSHVQPRVAGSLGQLGPTRTPGVT